MPKNIPPIVTPSDIPTPDKKRALTCGMGGKVVRKELLIPTMLSSKESDDVLNVGVRLLCMISAV
jgi:hypothetical protein